MLPTSYFCTRFDINVRVLRLNFINKAASGAMKTTKTTKTTAMLPVTAPLNTGIATATEADRDRAVLSVTAAASIVTDVAATFSSAAQSQSRRGEERSQPSVDDEPSDDGSSERPIVTSEDIDASTASTFSVIHAKTQRAPFLTTALLLEALETVQFSMIDTLSSRFRSKLFSVSAFS